MSFSENWSKATVDGSENTSPPPEGTYEVALVQASAFTSKKGAEIVKLEFRVVSVKEQGHEWTEIRSFASQGAANAAKATCFRLGVDVETVATLEELDSELKACAGRYYEVTVKRNGEYLNTYVEDVVTPSGGTPPAGDFQPAPVPLLDDDVPFLSRFPEIDTWRETHWSVFDR